MLATRASTQVSRRLLHTSSVQYGFMDWFSMKKDQQKKAKAEDTSKVIERAEKGEVTLSKVDKIEFIGKKSKKIESTLPVAERLQGFHIKHWLNKNKATTAQEFEQIIFQAYTKLTKRTASSLDDISLENLNVRFQVTKEVQSQSGYMIPDYILTKASDASVLQHYFETQILSGNYLNRNPDHLSVKELEFSSPNVSTQQPVTSKERKSKFKNLLKEAKLAQEEKAEKLIEGVRA